MESVQKEWMKERAASETNQFLLYSTLGMEKNSTGESQMNVYFSASERAFVHQ